MIALPPARKTELERAVRLLEQPRLAIRLANMAGKPIDGAMSVVPGVSGALHGALRKAILRCLTVAIESQTDEPFEPSRWLPKTLTGLTGGIGGLFGALAMPVELPFTMMLMLRAIADIARHNGEDLRSIESRLACLEVFALGERKRDAGAAVGYYAARTTLNKLTRDLVATLIERRMMDASAPVVTRLVGEVVSRLGLLLSERAAAGAIPILGALGGATLNVVFMDHFERVAEGHFTIRRLEREYGDVEIARLYRIAATDAVR